MSIDAMRLALAALEEYTNVVTSSYDPNSWVTVAEDGGKPARDAITALRAAIEQAPWVKSYAGGKPNYTTPEEKQEPVALRKHYENSGYTYYDARWKNIPPDAEPLYL